MKLEKTLWISSAHILMDYEGVCSRLHGHNLKIVVTVDGQPDDKTGMIIDFNRIKKSVMMLDHKFIVPAEHKDVLISKDSVEINAATNQKVKSYKFPKEDCFLMHVDNVTAENIAKQIKKEIEFILNNKKFIVKVKVYETESSCIETD